MAMKLPTWDDYLEQRRASGLGYPTPAEEKRARAALSRMRYNYKKRIEYDLASQGVQFNMMHSALQQLMKTVGAVDIEFSTRKGRFQTYPRAKLKLQNGSWVRYYFNKGQWRKS